MQLGFVIDHSRCIGCHACTIACKSENDVPLGDFRTWVKYTEAGEFPDVRRSFAVLRCNQCSDAPCVTICPVTALDKRKDGIVDVDHRVCIGCKACMQACPYDALYINDSSGTAEKCHFCAHRTEIGLAPACAVVCPTEAIIPGDFHDPGSRVSRMVAEGDLKARKVEAGTGPNVYYKDVSDAGIDPNLTNGAGGYLWSNQIPSAQLDAEVFEALEHKALDNTSQARTVYDVDQKPLWGWMVGAYMFTKSISAGAFLAILPLLAPMGFGDGISKRSLFGAMFFGFLFLLLTSALLIADLKRPERFIKILLRPNWNSWLAKGSVLLTGYGGFVTLGMMGPLLGWRPETWASGWVNIGGALLAIGTAVYTAWLLGQAKGRVLWLQKGLTLKLFFQALIGGGGLILLSQFLFELPTDSVRVVSFVLAAGLLGQLAMTLLEPALAPKGREQEYARAARLLSHGPYAKKHWGLGVLIGMVLPAILCLAGIQFEIAALAALIGLYVEEDLFIKAGQSIPIS